MLGVGAEQETKGRYSPCDRYTDTYMNEYRKEDIHTDRYMNKYRKKQTGIQTDMWTNIGKNNRTYRLKY